MSSDRPNNRPLKPTLAATRTPTATRTPLTPRIAGAPTSTSTTRPAAPRMGGRTPLASPRVKPQETPAKDASGNINVTPRSSARKSRTEFTRDSPVQDDLSNTIKPKSSLTPGDALSGRSSAMSGGSIGVASGLQSRKQASRPNSIISDNTSRVMHSPSLVRSPGFVDIGQSAGNETIDSRFFHASDVQKQEPAPKRPEPKKVPTFFYADGKEDTPIPPKASSPVLSAVNERRSNAPWITKSPPVLSPAFNASTPSLSYFPPTAPPQGQLRSPSPSKENIHLSYRKGGTYGARGEQVSQIFGTRPVPLSTPSSLDLRTQSVAEETPRRPSLGAMHRRSTSLSSVHSGTSQPARRRSNTALDEAATSSPLTHEITATSIPRVTSPPVELPSIDTSLASLAIVGSPPESTLSPTKSAGQLAADARRERKVLDLEISNSSLLAINSSLERELRRQKAELKRFRRLSRAGRFSYAPNDMPRRISDSLEPLSEDYEDGESRGALSGFADDDESESEGEESLLSGSEPLSPNSHNSKEQDRLAKDEKRLQIDLQRHKELLVQSQSMNQSLKRCMYATEEMIREGKKALEYHVRVSDVKLGGRILSEYDEEGDQTQGIDVEDALEGGSDNGMESAKGLLGIWSGVGMPNFEDSEGSGDRDSGIEVEKGFLSARSGNTSNPPEHSGRPPESVT